jgi:hypothetical protein
MPQSSARPGTFITAVCLIALARRAGGGGLARLPPGKMAEIPPTNFERLYGGGPRAARPMKAMASRKPTLRTSLGQQPEASVETGQPTEQTGAQSATTIRPDEPSLSMDTKHNSYAVNPGKNSVKDEDALPPIQQTNSDGMRSPPKTKANAVSPARIATHAENLDTQDAMSEVSMSVDKKDGMDGNTEPRAHAQSPRSNKASPRAGETRETSILASAKGHEDEEQGERNQDVRAKNQTPLRITS